MFARLGSLVSRYWAPIILAWLALAVGLHRVAPRWDDVTHDGDLAYLPARLPSVEGEALLAQAFPKQAAKSQIAVIVERSRPFTAADLDWIDSLAECLEKLRGELPITEILTRNSEVVGEKLLSRPGAEGQACVIAILLSNEFMAADNVRVLDRVSAALNDPSCLTGRPNGLEIGVTGSAAIGGDMIRSAAESVKNTEVTTVILVVVVLLLVYRAPAMIVIPMATIGVSLFVATDILAILAKLNGTPGFEWWHFKIFKTTKIFIVVILFGAGTDFCLFLISRFKEELERGVTRAQAVSDAVGHVGEAILASAMTTILGLGTMYFAAFGKFRNSGPAIALCLAVALAACLTLAPALLRAMGGVVFWPFASPSPTTSGHEREHFRGFWNWASRAILARPGLILVVSLVALAPFAYLGTSAELTYDFLSELSADRPSVQGTAMARRHFPAGETAPVTLLVMSHGKPFETSDGRKDIARLTKSLYDEINKSASPTGEMTNPPPMDKRRAANRRTARVRSLAEPLGDTPGKFTLLGASGAKKTVAKVHSRVKEHYLSQVTEFTGDVTRLELILKEDPFSAAAIETLNRLDGQPDGLLTKLQSDESSPWHGAQFRMIGTTAALRDLKAVTESDQWLISELVVLAVLGVLIALLRRPLICVYLIASVLLSYFVTVGATELFFQWLVGPTYPGLDWKVPIFLFVILIAVGEDYNIYLVSRVFEEQRKHGAREGLRLAIAQTGGIITSCGVIMAGTFVSMMTGALRGIQELGFALSLGVMLDTCIVRPVLAPAFMALLIPKRDEADEATPSVDARTIETTALAGPRP